MDPGTLAVLSLAATAGSTAIGVAGAAQTAQANQAAAQYQSAVAKNNAIIAGYNADYAQQQGQTDALNQGLKSRALIGSQKAAQAASGFDVNSGSPLDVRMSTAELGRLDTLTLLNNAAMRAYGFRTQQGNFTAESGFKSMQAEYAGKAGGYGVASSLLGGATSFSDKWLSYKNKGVFD